MSFEIRSVPGFETLPLRQKVLKPFASLQECAYPEDDLATTFHFALIQNSKIHAICTFILESHPEFSAKKSYRLRGMAVDKANQGQGYGKKLLQHGVDFLVHHDVDFIWFNAREGAFPFYQSMGFHLHGPLFELPKIGPHKVMYKRYDPR